MYIRITTRCNMSCAHCGFSCGRGGKDMPDDVFRAALRVNSDYGEMISLGGGEPTIHPKFWEFFGLALANTSLDDGGLFIATNGSVAETAIALARLAKARVITAALSRDPWHDPIESRVVAAFTKQQDAVDRSDYREIRNVSLAWKGLINAGRAKKNGLGNRNDSACICDEIVIDPDGKIWACGCRKVQFGTVYQPEIPQSYWESDTRCYPRKPHEQPRSEA
jgi:MoaA/NifB/PqqE/SkfB family radical SAM enzyme